MTKPDDIPQDVWDAANRALEPVAGTYASAQGTIARAIMAEREACVEFACATARNMPVPSEFSQAWREGYRAASLDITRAIRNRGER